MEHTTDIDREWVLAILHAAGLRAQVIPQANTRTCDLHGEDGDEQYLLEIKGVHDDEDVGRTLRDCRAYDGYREIATSPALSRRIERAVKQISDSGRRARQALRLVALVVRGPVWSGAIFDQILATLYGMGRVADLGPPPRPGPKCLYLRESAFHKHRLDLDGVLIVGNGGAGLCINDHNQRAARVRLSRLGRFFAEHGLLHYASRLETEGRFVVADCTVDRSNEHAVLRYVGDKYGFKRPIALRSHAFVAALSLAPERGE